MPSDTGDSGIRCLVLVARFHGISAEPDQLAHEFRVAEEPLSTMQLLLAGKKLGLTCRLIRPQLSRLGKISGPSIALANDGTYFILGKCGEKDGANQYLIQDPAVGRPQVLTEQEFVSRWSGGLVVFSSQAAVRSGLAAFDFTWFIPAVVKYRKGGGGGGGGGETPSPVPTPSLTA